MRQRKGFTLVELSIVLVIIGLLIGGILAAQSMISTAKINAQVRQIGQFDAMVLNFKTKFNYLPGDAPAFGGDGDGAIDATEAACSGCGDDVQTFFAEIGNFWHDADPEQYPGTALWAFPGSKPTTTGPSKNVPMSKFGKGGSFVIAAALSTDDHFADKTNLRNVYVILDPTQAQQLTGYPAYSFPRTTSTNSAVSPAELMSLDSKIDDGIANSGNVLSGAIAVRGCCSWGAPVAVPLATCSSGPTYDLTHDSYECTPLIRIGGSVGVPQ